MNMPKKARQPLWADTTHMYPCTDLCTIPIDRFIDGSMSEAMYGSLNESMYGPLGARDIKDSHQDAR